MSLVIPRDRLYECSASLQDTMEREGLTLAENPEQVKLIARYVLERELPELALIFKRAVAVCALSVLQVYDDMREPVMGAEFIGRFAGITVAELQIPEQVPGIGEVVTEKTDIILTFMPQIIRPDPGILAYSEQILAPMTELYTLMSVE